MTKALQDAFDAAARLSDDAQESLAQAILAELAADVAFERAFVARPDVLDRLADEALREHRAGETEALDPDAR